jgi:hypothetical protein
MLPSGRVDRYSMDDDFISEDDLLTFDGWMRYQATDPATSTPEELRMWRSYFDEGLRLRESSSKVGLMRLQPVPGEQKYAVAIRDGSNLWLTMWVRCSRKGEIFIMYPRGNREWDAHASYHLDGTLHQKSHGLKGLCQKRQPLTAAFRGSEHLGAYGGHGIGSGAVCDPKAFDGVIVVEPRILGPIHGSVAFDLVEPGYVPKPDPGVRERQIFLRGARPSVIITLYSDDQNIGFLHWPSSFIQAG